MANFYFDLDFDIDRFQFKDAEGIDFPDVEAARIEVLRTLAEIAKDALPKSDRQVFSASIRNASGDIVYSVKVVISGEYTNHHVREVSLQRQDNLKAVP